MSESFRRKVECLFRELAGERADTLSAERLPTTILDVIAAAHAPQDAGGEEALQADELAFHLADWNAEAAFLVALSLFPERFEAAEIRAGVDALLIHVPYHVLTAARLAGYPVPT